MIQKSKRHRNLRKTLRTPARCPWDTRQDRKRGSTGQRPGYFLLFTTEGKLTETAVLLWHWPGATLARSRGFWDTLCDAFFAHYWVCPSRVGECLLSTSKNLGPLRNGRRNGRMGWGGWVDLGLAWCFWQKGLVHWKFHSTLETNLQAWILFVYHNQLKPRTKYKQLMICWHSISTMVDMCSACISKGVRNATANRNQTKPWVCAFFSFRRGRKLAIYILPLHFDGLDRGFRMER